MEFSPLHLKTFYAGLADVIQWTPEANQAIDYLKMKLGKKYSFKKILIDHIQPSDDKKNDFVYLIKNFCEYIATNSTTRFYVTPPPGFNQGNNLIPNYVIRFTEKYICECLGYAMFKLINKYLCKLRYRVSESKEPFFITFPSIGPIVNELEAPPELVLFVLYLCRKLIRRKIKKKINYTHELLLEASLVTDDVFKLPLDFQLIADDLGIKVPCNIELYKVELKLFFSLLRNLKVEFNSLSLLPECMLKNLYCMSVDDVCAKVTSSLMVTLFALEMKD